jgi:ATP-dependent Lon protease
LLRNQLNVEPGKYNIHINFPGGAPIDGPSAGVTMATAIYSAISRTPVNNRVAMTGEVSIRGLVKAVGGVTTKISAAKQAGAAIVIIPRENWQESFRHIKDVEVVAVDRIEEVIDHALVKPEQIRLEVVNSTPTAVYTTTGGVSV